jgi:hypothetical protein
MKNGLDRTLQLSTDQFPRASSCHGGAHNHNKNLKETENTALYEIRFCVQVLRKALRKQLDRGQGKLNR